MKTMKARQGWWDAIRHVKSVARGTHPSLNPGLSWTILDIPGSSWSWFHDVSRCFTMFQNVSRSPRPAMTSYPLRQASDASNFGRFGSFGRRCHLGVGLGRCQLRLDLRQSLRLQRRCVAKDGCWAPWPQAVEPVHVWTSVMFSER